MTTHDNPHNSLSAYPAYLGGVSLYLQEVETTATTQWIPDDDMDVVLALLMPGNRIACQLAIHTGLRISDVLRIKTDQLAPRITVREAKTGKSRRISVPRRLLDRIRDQAGPYWAFPSPRGEGHRTRQAVWADIKRAQRAIRLPANIGPHSLRKSYAVRMYDRTHDLAAVQRALNHTDPAVTMLYAMADHLAQQHRREGSGRRSRPR